MASEILPWLFVGNWQEAQTLSRDEWVTFTCAHDSPFKGTFFYPMRDGADCPPNLIDEAAQQIKDAEPFLNGRKILVHCMSGFSRSPAVVVRYLCMTGMTFNDAVKLVESKRPIMIENNPNQGLRDLVKKLCESA